VGGTCREFYPSISEAGPLPVLILYRLLKIAPRAIFLNRSGNLKNYNVRTGKRQEKSIFSLPGDLKIIGSVGAFCIENGKGRFCQQLYVKEKGPFGDILDIHPYHLFEGRGASAFHLPDAGDARFCFQNPSFMPQTVIFEFIGQAWPRPHKRHVAEQYIDELG
jgi:hypothetical protein